MSGRRRGTGPEKVTLRKTDLVKLLSSFFVVGVLLGHFMFCGTHPSEPSRPVLFGPAPTPEPGPSVTPGRNSGGKTPKDPGMGNHRQGPQDRLSVPKK
jgi:hypothetical protein